MPALRRFFALKAADRALVLEAAVIAAFVRISVRAVPFARLHGWLERWSCRWTTKPCAQPPASISLARRVAAAVSAAVRHLPGRSTCLVEALVVEAMLRRRGARPELRFGVRRPQGAERPFEAHAWVETNGRIVIGDLDGLDHYAVLTDARSS